jgi:hypothetical protein
MQMSLKLSNTLCQLLWRVVNTLCQKIIMNWQPSDKPDIRTKYRNQLSGHPTQQPEPSYVTNYQAIQLNNQNQAT